MSSSLPSPMGCPGLWMPIGLAAWEEMPVPAVPTACLIQKDGHSSLSDAFKWSVQSLALEDNTLACWG